MDNTDEYSLALMLESGGKLERLKLYVEVIPDNKIRYKALDFDGKEQEGLITKDDAFTQLNWHLLDNNCLASFQGLLISSVIFSVAIDRGHIPMSHLQKLHRAGLLCVYFVTNYAYYKAGWDENISKAKKNFWIITQNNFIDMAILEWSKLFLKPKNSKYHWKKIVKDRTKFDNIVKQFDHKPIEIYRDRFIAHLDNKTIMNIPKLDNALDLVFSLYSDVYSQLEGKQQNNLPVNLKKYYEKCLLDAVAFYP